jgi:hypothetical protein
VLTPGSSSPFCQSLDCWRSYTSSSSQPVFPLANEHCKSLDLFRSTRQMRFWPIILVWPIQQDTHQRCNFPLLILTSILITRFKIYIFVVLLKISPTLLIYYTSQSLLATLLFHRWLPPHRGLSLSCISHCRSRSYYFLWKISDRKIRFLIIVRNEDSEY